MSVPFREPYYSYDELVEVVTLNYRVEDLPALEEAAGEPRERLWLIESAGEVYRVWLKGRGLRARWTMDCEHALETEVRVNQKLIGTVLARLNNPEGSRDYALEPDRAEKDLAVLEELERVWLSGARNAAFPLAVLPGMRANPLRAEELICDRISRIEAELARAKALRVRNLTEAYGNDAKRVAVELGVELGEARDILAAREEYHSRVWTGAAYARNTIPVRKPAGPTGLPDDLATRLMTAACDTETVLADEAYPEPLPPDLAPWYVYIENLGHCIAVAVDGVYKPDGDPWEYMTVAPVRMVRDMGWKMQDGLVLAPVPYIIGIGAVECDDADLEF